MTLESLALTRELHEVYQLEETEVHESEIGSNSEVLVADVDRQLACDFGDKRLKLGGISVSFAVLADIIVERIVDAGDHVCVADFLRVSTEKLRIPLHRNVLHDRF